MSGSGRVCFVCRHFYLSLFLCHGGKMNSVHLISSYAMISLVACYEVTWGSLVNQELGCTAFWIQFFDKTQFILLVIDSLTNLPSVTIEKTYFKKQYFRHSPYEHVKSQLEQFFSQMFPSERWIIVEPSLARDDAMGSPWL